jgi:HSP20 family protein
MFTGLQEWNFLPPMDVYETDNAIFIEMELPEVEISNIKIVCEGNKLIIEGMKNYKIGLENVKFLRLERHTGPFQRIIHLPFIPKNEDIKATLKHGVLKIEVPKRTQTIKVEEENE